MTNHLREIEALGQSIWLDNISRALIEDGDLQRLVDEDGLTGVTSNPTIFEKAMGHSDRYDEALPGGAGEGLDARGDLLPPGVPGHPRRRRPPAADLRADRRPGRLHLLRAAARAGHDADGSVEAAQRHWRSRSTAPTCYIKVPGTEAGVTRVRGADGAGISVNVTLLFAVSRYEEIAEAYVAGSSARRGRASRSTDRLGGQLLRLARGHQDRRRARGAGPRGPAGQGGGRQRQDRLRVVPADLLGPRWEALEEGRQPQRPLWASTSTKNPNYPDTLYVDELIGPDTVNTMPDQTIAAARDHADPTRTDRPRRRGRARAASRRSGRSASTSTTSSRPAGRGGRRLVREVVRLARRDHRREAGGDGQGHCVTVHCPGAVH